MNKRYILRGWEINRYYTVSSFIVTELIGRQIRKSLYILAQFNQKEKISLVIMVNIQIQRDNKLDHFILTKAGQLIF